MMTQQNHLSRWLLQNTRRWFLLIDPVREAPAAARVAVSVSGVDEAVLEWPADIMSRQTCHWCHHISGERPHLESALVLTSPPVVLRPEGQWGWVRTNHRLWHRVKRLWVDVCIELSYTIWQEAWKSHNIRFTGIQKCINEVCKCKYL